MMKLSEAIRAGAKLRAASEHGWSDIGPDGEARTCALSAAMEGAGLITFGNGICRVGPNGVVHRTPGSIDYRTGDVVNATVILPESWIRVRSKVVLPPCPCAKHGGPESVLRIVWHLHDIHQWSREAVAEWIETIEDSIQARDEKPAPEKKKTHELISG